MKKRILYSLIIFMLSQFLLACLGLDNCGCKRGDIQVKEHFDVNGMVAGFAKYDPNGYSYRGYYEDTIVSSVDFVKDSAAVYPDTIMLLVAFKANLVAAQTRFHFSIVNTAMAQGCSPPQPGYKGSEELIDSLYIVPVGHFGNDSTYADTLYSLTYFNGFYMDGVYMILNGVRTEVSLVNHSQGLYGRSLSTNRIGFTIIRANARFIYGLYMRFRVVVKFANGERYEALTSIVRFDS